MRVRDFLRFSAEFYLSNRFINKELAQTTPPMGKRIVCTIFNDPFYDQRMERTCRSLTEAGYEVLLVGRKSAGIPGLANRPYAQRRISSWFRKGPMLYAEYNLRLLFVLLFTRADLFCAIDLDTILPVLWISRLKRVPRVYDAHELFCEMQEIVTRPRIYRFWKFIERKTVPNFVYGYTVNEIIAAEFSRMYGVRYAVIRNMARREPLPAAALKKEDAFFIYQGAVNEGRSFETLIPAMQQVKVPLHIYGDGNFMDKAVALVKEYGLEDKVLFKGLIAPEALRLVTPGAIAGITLFDKTGISNYYSLANRFFDYIQAGIPQVCCDYPAYRAINNLYHVAVLVDDLSPASLSAALNRIAEDAGLQSTLSEQCRKAREVLNWQEEEKKLIRFYTEILPLL